MAPRRVFYGWWVLTASVVIELFGLGFGIFAMTTAYPYLIDTFPDWPRSTIFAATSVIILVAGAMAPVTGAFIDRYPIRWLFAAGIVVQTIAVLWFSRITTPAGYLGSAALLGLGLSGMTVLPNQVLVSRWFHDRLGLVNGVILASTALGGALAPAIVTRLIEMADWRTAFGWIAFLGFVPAMLMVVFVVRDRPEDLGLRPYGWNDDAVVPAPSSPEATTEVDTALARALRSRSFWALGIAIFLGGMPCYSYNKHILVFLKELGWAPVPAADLKTLFFLVAACARLEFGWLCDRFDRRTMVAVHVGMIAVASSLQLLVPGQPALLVPTLLVLAVGYGGLLPAIPILAVTYFGRASLGTILGVYKIPYDLAAAGAPVLTAYLYDVSGAYTLPHRVNAVFALIGVVAALLLAPTSTREPVSALAEGRP
jgi:sugar phosphate permease